MSKARWMFWRVGLSVVVAAGVVMNASPDAWADLVNKYTFNNGNAQDSLGGQHGTVVDNTGLAKYVGGMIDLSGNSAATGSYQDFSLPGTAGAYVDLPNQIFTNAVKNGTYGAVTLEVFFKVSENHNWAEVFSFGTSRFGENSSEDGSNSDYVALIPRSDVGDFRATTRSSGNTEGVAMLTPGAAPLNTMQHVVFVMDQGDTNGGVNLNGTATLYLNKGTPVKAPLQPFIDQMGGDFSTGGDVNNWLGRSPWPDPLFDGSIDEFRIYDHALTLGEVTASPAPEAAPLPKLIVDRATGQVSISNPSGSGIMLKGYSIGSPTGGLNTAGWQSIDHLNGFDDNGAWTTQSLSTTVISESVTGGTTDGGLLGAGVSRGISIAGSGPWFRTPFQDVTFSFTLGDNSTGFGIVEYTGTPIGRSDFNGDGSVDASDWAMFLPNAYTDISGESLVGAFRKGDTDGDRDNDFRDYRNFKRDFVAQNGAAAFAQLPGAVPEPGMLSLIAMAAGTALGVGRRRAG